MHFNGLIGMKNGEFRRKQEKNGGKKMDTKELRSIYDHANPIENIGGVSIIAMSEEHKNWLIDQVEKYEKALKKIRLLPWSDVMDAPQIAFEALKDK
jgi:hypothetical protein